tara:strand:- start:73 stop:477 length:405 start_codon:yes stop_codon:yes gene_type:complete
MKFNTAISRLMELINHISGRPEYEKELIEVAVMLLAPICPHICEEIWDSLGNNKSVFDQDWPIYNPDMLISDTVEVAVQVNGKLRGRITVQNNADSDVVTETAKNDANVKKFLNGTIIKEIVIPNKIVNFVVKN